MSSRTSTAVDVSELGHEVDADEIMTEMIGGGNYIRYYILDPGRAVQVL